MRRFLFLTAVVALLPSGTLRAAPSEPASFPDKSYDFADVTITPTPEMWFYLQELRRHDDPGLAVRRNAELRAAQRRNRLASMRWFGLSNQRPQANPTPTYGVYSPAWAAGLWQPYLWAGDGYPALLLVANGVVSTGSR